MNLIQLSALSGALAVAFGAFGAHALKAHLDVSQLAVYQTAFTYHMAHSLAAFTTLCFAQNRQSPKLYNAAALFLLGVLLFSGSLYLLAITGISWLGAITPLGGVSFIVAWIIVVLNVKGSVNGH